MKNSLLLVAFICLSITMYAQKASVAGFKFPSMDTKYADNVRIHITYTTTTIGAFRLYTSLQNEPIKLRRRKYILLVSDNEQIDFFRNTEVNNLPIQLSFERGKDYYFRIELSINDGFNITEMTERAFQMDIFMKNIYPKPEIYDYTKAN